MAPLKTLAAAALLGFAGAASAQITLTLSSWVPQGHLLTKMQLDWCMEVSKAAEGRIQCNMLPKPVAPAPATFDAVRDGLVDVAFSVHGYTPGRYDLTKIAEMPFLGDSAIPTSVAYQRIYERHLAKFDEHKGMKVITVFTHGPGQIFNNKRPVRSLADLDGIKFRVGGGIVNEVGKVIGANMTLKPAPQSYELLSTGVVDGVWFPDESVVGFRLEKHIKYRTSLPGGLYNTSFAMVMNPATWAKIPKADQAIIEKHSGEWAARFIGKYWDDYDIRSRATQQALGIESITADAAFVADFKAKTAPIEAAWAKEAEAKGLKNAAAILQEFRAEIAKLQ
ncbi:MAG: TRAP transporter substrate-binding protein [Rhodoferax sp.]|jgi:TRAP-type C4-dicarboxylate transport system substrate-binding protein|nr:TRAP transporter substrate-binding protein [Rhodoferax sp.]MCL4738800.1 TRAP transporter substrate-binding protein [Burkholderiaceae bacterium]MCP5290428.1 TRAP transporter substrate-binding protein [Burkholderiaceae bacterium]